jgi:DNA-binding IclR family transcriptional regulator
LKSYKRIEAVVKTGAILKYLATQKEPVAAPAIAQATNMPTPTVMCHLVTLEEIGFTERVSDRWMLGFGLALIRARIKSNLEAERDRIDRDMRELEEAEHGE